MRKLDQLSTYEKQLAEFKNVTLSAYRGDWKTQRVVERTLQVVVETCVDIANHIISDSGMRAPSSYADSFSVLHENGVVSAESHAQLAKMAKFRNVIVHQYEEIDPSIMISILRGYDSTIDQYKQQVLTFLRQDKPQA